MINIVVHKDWHLVKIDRMNWMLAKPNYLKGTKTQRTDQRGALKWAPNARYYPRLEDALKYIMELKLKAEKRRTI